MDEVNWGIIGTAGIADKVAKAIASANGARLAAVASRDRGRAEAWGAERGVPSAFGSYGALLDDESIDAVYIPLPPSMHMEWTVKAAEKGKHVLCEKPLALDLKQAGIMRDACRDNGVQLMDGVMWVHHLRADAMRQEIENGRLGELRRVSSAFTFSMAPERTDNIRLQKELGGGCLGDLGYYSVRAILWAFGAMPEAVYSSVRYYNGVDMNVSALLWFGDDRMAALDCGFDTYMRQWFEIVGTEGSIVCDDFVAPSGTEDARYWLHRNRAAETVKGQPCAQEVRMIERFSTAIMAGEPRPTWAVEAVETTIVCDAIRRSWSVGKKVELAA
jgi:predicted dehydrogenase